MEKKNNGVLVKSYRHDALKEKDNTIRELEEKLNKEKGQVKDHSGKSVNKEFQVTPREMAEKLLEFNRDFSTDSCDGEEERKKELEVVTKLFDRLQKSDEFNILALHLDLMFMDSAFV